MTEKKYELSDLTELEQQFIREVNTESTGYIYTDYVNMEPHVMGGVITSLISKGILDTEIDDRFFTSLELFPCEQYEDWFPSLYC